MDLPGDSVVGIIDDHEAASQAMGRLIAAGFEDASLLHGEEGRSLLAEDPEEGIGAAVKRMIEAFGDQTRIRDRLDTALANGASVISVPVETDSAGEVTRLLEAHGGHDMWRLGEWSQNRVGEKGSGEG